MVLYQNGSPTSGVLKVAVKLFPLGSVDEKKNSITYLRQKNYPFNIFEPIFLEYFKNQAFQCKVRVYIFRCLSLAA